MRLIFLQFAKTNLKATLSANAHLGVAFNNIQNAINKSDVTNWPKICFKQNRGEKRSRKTTNRLTKRSNPN